MNLNELREKIDTIDTELVNLLNERAKVAIEIGKAKKGAPIYQPGREKIVLQRVADKNEGPLSDEALHTIYSVLIAICREIQR